MYENTQHMIHRADFLCVMAGSSPQKQRPASPWRGVAFASHRIVLHDCFWASKEMYLEPQLVVAESEEMPMYAIYAQLFSDSAFRVES